MTWLFNHTYQKPFRQHLRNNATGPEKLLWQHLKGRQLSDTKFRRQHGIGGFIVDFYCPEYRLAIEVDGPVHWTKEQKEYDTIRENFIRQFGIRIIRFTNEEVHRNLESVLARIAEELEEQRSGPPPLLHKEGDWGRSIAPLPAAAGQPPPACRSARTGE